MMCGCVPAWPRLRPMSGGTRRRSCCGQDLSVQVRSQRTLNGNASPCLAHLGGCPDGLPHPLPDVAGPAGRQEIVTEAKQRELLLLRFQHHVEAHISDARQKADKLVPIDPIAMLTRLRWHTHDRMCPCIRVSPRDLSVCSPLRRKMDLGHLRRRPGCHAEAKGIV